MIQLVTTAEAKLYLRIDQDADDALIETLIAAACEATIATADGWTPNEADIPARMKLATLAHIANAYDDRANGVDQPASATRLLTTLRRLDV